MIAPLSILAGLLATLLMHPVHETVCEVEWNAKTRCVEVALRLDALDEQWIERELEIDTRSDWHARFLQSQLFFDPVADKDTPSKLSGRPIKWIGRKEDGAHVWWFFEVVCADGKPPTLLQTRLFFDRHHDYQHRVVVLGRETTENHKRPSFLLTAQEPQAKLVLVK